MIDFEKVKLTKDAGPVVFLGSMNAMPMMYAKELRKKGYEVVYFVDRPKSDTLSRPEYHFPDIEYPYPSWIIEIGLRTQVLLPYFRRFFSWYLQREVKKVTLKKPQLFILNGLFISLSPYLSATSIPKIALCHGSDLDTWADIAGVRSFSSGFSKRSIFKFFPAFISKRLIEIAVYKQFEGFKCSEALVYFPKGFNEIGDRVVNSLTALGVSYIERYDISFEPLKDCSREYKKEGDKLIVFSGVRFLYQSFPEGNSGYSKGNDLIITGLANFYKTRKNIEVHFVEKGEDVVGAKLLCDKTGLSPAVVWHKEMEFRQLLNLYNKSDICFDQVGKHWIGAIGGYALFLGKPLIANDRPAVLSGVWPKENPVFSASNADEVYNSLMMLEDDELRRDAHKKSKDFAEKYMGPERLLDKIFLFG